MTRDLDRRLNHPTTFLGRKLLPKGRHPRLCPNMVCFFTTDCGSFYLEAGDEADPCIVVLIAKGLPIYKLLAYNVKDAEDKMRAKVEEIAKATTLLHESLTAGAA